MLHLAMSNKESSEREEENEAAMKQSPDNEPTVDSPATAPLIPSLTVTKENGVSTAAAASEDVTPTKSEEGKRGGKKSLLQVGGIGIEKRRRSSATPGYKIENQEVILEGGKDGEEGRRFTIVKVQEKHGDFRKAVPILPLPVAVPLCVINLVLPGIGTFLSAFCLLCCGSSEHSSKGIAFFFNIVASFLQLLLAVVIIGWIWSVKFGVTLVQNSITSAVDAREEKNKDEEAGGSHGGTG